MLLLTDSIITFLCKLQQNMNDRNTVGKSYSPPLEKMMKATNPFQSNSQTIIKANVPHTYLAHIRLNTLRHHKAILMCAHGQCLLVQNTATINGTNTQSEAVITKLQKR